MAMLNNQRVYSIDDICIIQLYGIPACPLHYTTIFAG